MKLVSFEHGGQSSYGLMQDDTIIDVGFGLKSEFPTLRSALPHQHKIQEQIDRAPQFAVSDVGFLPVITDPGRIICVGLNYKSHIAETGRDEPKYPIIFPRYPDSLVGNGVAMVRPVASKTFDFEGELAFVIGKEGRHISESDAMEHVAGYACFNDGSIREYQRHTSQFMPGKCFWKSGSFGPYLATRDEIPDPQNLHLQTRLNGEVMQDTNTSDLLFGIPQLIAYLSDIFPLQPGDVVATGTTGGVGAFRDPKVWMKAGDTIEVEISGLGTLSNPIVDE